MSLIKGRNLGISNADYHGDRTYMSSSGLKTLLKDQDDYYRQYILGIKNESKDFFNFGNYVHTIILEPDLVESEYALFTGAKKIGVKYNEFVEENEGKIIISKSEAKLAAEMMKGYEDNVFATSLIQNGLPEDTYTAEINGVNLKARTDYISGNYIADVKTTKSILTRSEILKTIIKYGYDISAAMYMDVVNDSREEKVEEFYFIFMSKKNGETLVVKASEELLRQGREKYLYGLKLYKSLKKDGFFEKDKPKVEMITI